MDKSFGHWIDTKGIEGKQERYRDNSKESGKPGVQLWTGAGDPTALKSSAACSAKDCYKMPEYRCCYRYITGKAGRVSYAERHYCADHARKFAVKNKILLPQNYTFYGGRK